MLMIGGLTNKTATDRETDGDGRRKLVERGTVRGEDGERERERDKRREKLRGREGGGGSRRKQRDGERETGGAGTD